jgi:hypothetical protein
VRLPGPRWPLDKENWIGEPSPDHVGLPQCRADDALGSGERLGEVPDAGIERVRFSAVNAVTRALDP